MKCMKDEEKKRLGLLTKGYELGVGRKRRGKKVFGEMRGFGSRERRKR